LDWFPFHVSDLSSAKVSAATSHAFGAWVRVLGNCYRLENGGCYKQCYEHSDRQWMSMAGVDREEVDSIVKAGLATWIDGDLVVDGYDKDQESKATSRSKKGAKAAEIRWVNARSITASNARSNAEERRGEEKKGEEREIPARDPSATGTEHVALRGDHWLSSFGAAWSEKHGRMYGRASADSRSAGEFTDLLASLPPEEVSSLWERRKELFAEFFDTADPRTVKAGCMFSFFVGSFRGFMIPKDKRELGNKKNNTRGGKAETEW
jgi:hypothetical protein